LILAHQELRQLWNKDTDVASAVISNPYTRICFRCGDFDAQKLKDGFSFFGTKDLQNLGTGQAIARIEKAEYDFNLKTFPLPESDPVITETRSRQITALSRNTYATSRAEVENALAIDEGDEKDLEVITANKQEKKGRAPQKRQLQKKTDQEPKHGRGGLQHQYIQQMIKRAAGNRGYEAIIEKSILSGTGCVDVSLEKKDRKIACEISVTTSKDHELNNLQKCLAAGYEEVIIVSSEKKVLDKVKRLARQELSTDLFKKVLFLLPEELISYLEAGEVKSVRGDSSLPGNKEIMTAKELESLLKIDVKTIYSYAQKGLIPYVRIQSNLRFLRSEILEWVETHKFRPKSRSSRK